MQVGVQHLAQVGQRGFGRPIRQALRQAPETRHAGHQCNVSAASGYQRWQHHIEHIDGADIVHFVVRQHLRAVESGSPLRDVVAGAAQHQVDRTAARQRFICRAHRIEIADVQWQDHHPALGMQRGKRMQSRRIACRHRHAGAACQQRIGRGTTDAGRGADDPRDLAVPVFQRRIEGSEQTHACSVGHDQRLRNDNVASPTRMPNLLMTVRLSTTRSSTAIIQSSICTS